MKQKDTRTLSVFAQRLGQARRASGFTQQEVADRLQMHRSTYAYYETGTTEPSVDTLRRLSEMLQVSADYLIGAEENKYV